MSFRHVYLIQKLRNVAMLLLLCELTNDVGRLPRRAGVFYGSGDSKQKRIKFFFVTNEMLYRGDYHAHYSTSGEEVDG